MIGALGKAISAATDFVTSTVSDTVSTLTGKGSSGGGIFDVFDKFSSVFGDDGVFGKLKDIVTSGSLGTMLNTAMDSLGLPDWVGDIAGAALDFCTGNFVGAAANALDALEDVAKACGGDELAGFLKAGSEVTGMFAGGGLGAMGKAGDVAQTAGVVAGHIETGLDVAAKVQDGDVLGAGMGVFNMFGGDLGAVGESLTGAIDSDLLNMATSVFAEGEALTGKVQDAVFDGRLSLSNLGQQAMGAVANELGIDLDNPTTSKLLGTVLDLAESGTNLREMPGALLGSNLVTPGLTGTFNDILTGLATEQLSEAELPEAITRLRDMINQKADLVKGILNMASQAPAELRELADIINQLAARTSEAVDLASMHCASLRA